MTMACNSYYTCRN